MLVRVAEIENSQPDFSSHKHMLQRNQCSSAIHVYCLFSERGLYFMLNVNHEIKYGIMVKSDIMKYVKKKKY